MKSLKKYSVIYFLLSFILKLPAQDKLSLQQAIAIALENNYSILIARNESEISKNNVTRGNAGMLPQLNLTASGAYSGNDTKQLFTTGNEIDKKGAQSNTIASGLQMNWTLFDGMKMFITYDKLAELNTMNEIATKIQIENSVVSIIAAYYDIVRQKQLLKVNENLIALDEDRINITKTRWEIGKSAKTDYLQAQIELNTQKINRVTFLSQLSTLKSQLNRILSRSPQLDFDVDAGIEINVNLKLDELIQTSLSTNMSLLFYRSNLAINEFTLREIKTARYPNVSLNAGYNFTKTNNQASFLLFNRNLGWNAGLSANWTLFNGYNTNRNIKNAEISLKNAQWMLDDKKSEIQSILFQSFQTYQSALTSLQLNQDNTTLAKENMDIILESFRLGKATTLELKEAQKSYEDAQTLLLQTQYTAKIAETDLLKLEGELVK